jgi:hypothetical protein
METLIIVTIVFIIFYNLQSRQMKRSCRVKLLAEAKRIRSIQQEPPPCPRFRRVFSAESTCVRGDDLKPFSVGADGTFVGYFQQGSSGRPEGQELQKSITRVRPEESLCVKIEIRGDRCFVTDNRTKGGTFVGQALIPVCTEIELKKNDALCIGCPVINLVAPPEWSANTAWMIEYAAFTYCFDSAAFVKRERVLETQAVIRAFVSSKCESITLDAPPAIKDQMMCGVCYDWYQSPCVISGCGHKFCHACIKEWFAKGQGKPSCPTCRLPLPIVDGSPKPLLTPCFTTEALLCQYIDPKLTLPDAETRRQLSSVVFATTRADLQSSAQQDAAKIGHLMVCPSNYSTDLIKGSNDTKRVCIASGSIKTEHMCPACDTIIPAGYARIISRSGYHFHGSVLCALGMSDELAANLCVVLPEVTEQESRLLLNTVHLVMNNIM